jgi:hypothetical protein
MSNFGTISILLRIRTRARASVLKIGDDPERYDEKMSLMLCGTKNYENLTIKEDLLNFFWFNTPELALNLTHRVTRGTPGRPAEYITSSALSILF